MICAECGREWVITDPPWVVCEGEDFHSQECAEEYGAVCQ